METRINIEKVDSQGYQAMLGMEAYLAKTSLTSTHKHLIKIRASQINGCAYCINMHSKEARKSGETEQRIYALSAWRDTPFFSETERAILALTEEVTLIHNQVSDDTYNTAANLLGEKYLAEVIMAAVVINGWNRISVSTRKSPPLD